MGNSVVQWQIVTKNPDSLAKFYSEVFEWKIDSNNSLNYRMVDTGNSDGINGGIWPAPPNAQGFVQLFIKVDNVGESVTKAAEHGARVLIPPQKLPAGDELAILQDPEGIPFGIMKSAKS